MIIVSPSQSDFGPDMQINPELALNVNRDMGYGSFKDRARNENCTPKDFVERRQSHTFFLVFWVD